jgi:hemolysin activation/secretion protein
MSKATVWVSAVVALGLGWAIPATAQDAGFDIARFQVDGNSILSVERIDGLVAPFVGKRRVYGDVQKALEALENEYRTLGYGTVQVYVPEQELTSGVVRLLVSEGAVGKVTITGNKYFNAENIRAGLPQLQEGTAPNMRQLSENVQLSNENPAKQVEVTLGTSEEEGKVDVRVEVKEEDPERFYVTLDNTGTKATGKHRLGFSYQNANIGNSDQVLTLAYTTAIDPPGGMKVLGNRVNPMQDSSGVKVDIFSIGYRLPLYWLGDSIDFIYGNSSTNTPASVLAPGGSLALSGKGEVFGFRYNHIFPRAGEYSSKLVLGYDYKYMNSRCTMPGTTDPASIDPLTPPVASCVPYTLRPVTATYSGQWQKPGEAIDFNIGVTHNLFPVGSRYQGVAGIDRYSLIAANGQGKDEFSALRFGGSYAAAVAGDWLLRLAVSGQHAWNPLPSGEQLGLAGSNAVRGFLERAVTVDRGYVANVEAYSPDVAASVGLPGNLKWLVFYDSANGYKRNPSVNQKVNIASLGVGLRYNIKKDVSARLDVARVMDGYWPNGAPNVAVEGDIRGHFSLAFGF